MASTYSSSLRIQLIETGTDNEAWGQPLDNNLGTIIEQAITGVNSISLTNLTSYTLSAANASPDQARNAVLVFTGALSANCNVVAPAVKKVYIVSNQTTGGKNISITVGSGANVAVANGTNQLVYCNGTSFKSAVDVNSINGNLFVSGNASVGGNVTVSGGTVFGSGNITTTNGNLTLRSTTSNVVNFQGSTGALIPPFGSTAQRPATPQVGMSRWNTTFGWYEIWNGTIWQQITGSYSVVYLVVSGGGGGGPNHGGGGGAGGILNSAVSVAPGTAYTITVGAGGSTSGTSGSNSTAFSLTPIGGGSGGSGDFGDGSNGGSGGGGSGPNNDPAGGNPGGSGTSGQGFAGGYAKVNGDGGNLCDAAGGGGAGAVGASTNPFQPGGAGGIGVQSSITGTATYYAGGGGGGSWGAGGGSGGQGGGGAGSTSVNGGQAGSANSGGGGGGSGNLSSFGGAGGSGVVIISYASTFQRATGGTVTSYTSSGITYWVHTFTSSGTFAT